MLTKEVSLEDAQYVELRHLKQHVEMLVTWLVKKMNTLNCHGVLPRKLLHLTLLSGTAQVFSNFVCAGTGSGFPKIL